MKTLKILFLILILSYTSFAQLVDHSTQQSYINSNIASGLAKGAIKGDIVNEALNRLLDQTSGVFHDQTRPYYEDSSLIIKNVTGVRGLYISNTNSSGTFNSADWDKIISVGSTVITLGNGSDADGFDISIGNDVMSNSSISEGNVVIGYDAISNSSVATVDCVVIGRQAGENSAVGSDNSVIIGKYAAQEGIGNDNVYIGSECAESNTSGGQNVFSGYKAGESNTTGSFNVISGYQAGAANISGSYNTILGYQAGLFNLSKTENVYIGNSAGYQNQGNNNIFLGDSAGYERTGDSNWILIGRIGTNLHAFESNMGTLESSINTDLLVSGSYANQSDEIVSAAATITIDENNVLLLGTADIDSISTSSDIPDYGIIYIEFLSNAASVGMTDGKNLKLSGDFAFTLDDMMVLQRRGSYFYEVSRSAN